MRANILNRTKRASFHNSFVRGFAGKSVAARPFTFNYDITKLYETNYNNVPVLPIPEVKNTLKAYLRSVRPFLTTEEYARTVDIATEFEKNDAPELQKLLHNLNQNALNTKYPFSYVEKFWDNMYLGGRWSLPINSNPFYILQDDPNPADQEQCKRAAKFVNATAKWWLKVRGGGLEVDVERDGSPLCINKYFKIDIIKDNKSINKQTLEMLLRKIVTDTPLESETSRSEDVGVLTTQDRVAVYETRKAISAYDKRNASAFNTLDTALFVLTLDENNTKDLDVCSKIALTGANGTSRWFDKHSAIVDKAGNLMGNFEHSSGDGLTWNRWMTEVWYHMNNINDNQYPYSRLTGEDYAANTLDEKDMKGAIQKVQWILTEEHKDLIRTALRKVKDNISNVDLKVLDFDDFGKNEVKNWKVSPDAVSQMAMQVAYHRTKLRSGNPQEATDVFRGVPTYEACAMKNYFHGRTETIRSCTVESTQMSKLFLNSERSAAIREAKREAFIAACRVHIEVAKGAKTCSGPFQGVDRHLYALRNIAEENKMTNLRFYNDFAYKFSTTWLLSTSNVTTPFFKLFGFGAVTGNGYGLGYQTLDDSLPFCVTSFKDSQDGTDCKKYTTNLAEALTEFKGLFQN